MTTLTADTFAQLIGDVEQPPRYVHRDGQAVDLRMHAHVCHVEREVQR
jgi:hypothetical protein